ncbi:MAG: bifunctional transcriptional activator/DNA repair enzyme AdaA [Alicyclobacillus herbarius]|uniref:bifunctional transcriptional activator/DNA repair enzyme AdaA n=1 Tax=Alicyclobacillus herbarius TaxID=122960 RepID=UPI0023559188|nr:bifunctional transcriptional activator/DNA repair enzyme AdaA [Alicyclobacillus herbarius]MCL6633215.1 bifunctional transcriptional activator/DNA repair enzyme AdaA [Alicyclobacillus herbarius]
MTVDDALWEAIVNCEPTFDGQFFYAVISTGIFCRPSCRSRTPLRENVRIFRSVEDARAAGFRPCKRCRPDALGPDEELVQSAIEIMEQRYQDPLTLDTLARELAISPYHLHRIFKRLTGTTPADYVLDKRLRVAKEALRNERYRTVTDIAMGVGFRSTSHFSTVFRKETGYSPSDYREFHLRKESVEEATR